MAAAVVLCLLPSSCCACCRRPVVSQLVLPPHNQLTINKEQHKAGTRYNALVLSVPFPPALLASMPLWPKTVRYKTCYTCHVVYNTYMYTYVKGIYNTVLCIEIQALTLKCRMLTIEVTQNLQQVATEKLDTATAGENSCACSLGL